MSISQLFPEEGPTLNLNFAGSKTLDPRITFSRTSTGTYMDDSGLIKVAPADAPRFDHRYVNGQLESLGLLVEEQRSNLLTYSEDFSVWTKQTGVAGTYVGLASTDIISPDGTSNATKFYVANEGGGFYSLYRSVGITSNINYTYSVFMKKNEEDIVYLTVYTGSSPTGGNQLVSYNLTSGTVTGITTTGTNTGISSASITPYNNDWYRCSMTFQLNVSTTVQIKLGADISSLNESIYIWGAQLEQGSFPTSYIPRPDTSTATRTPDNASITGDNFSDWYNQSEGTIVSNYSTFRPTGANSADFAIVSSEAVPLDRIVGWQNTNRTPLFSVIQNNTNNFLVGKNEQYIDRLVKKALAIKTDNMIVSVDGNLYSSDLVSGVSDTLPITFNRILFGYEGIFASYLNGHIRGFIYYPTRLTNTQLQTLTK